MRPDCPARPHHDRRRPRSAPVEHFSTRYVDAGCWQQRRIMAFRSKAVPGRSADGCSPGKLLLPHFRSTGRQHVTFPKARPRLLALCPAVRRRASMSIPALTRACAPAAGAASKTARRVIAFLRRRSRGAARGESPSDDRRARRYRSGLMEARSRRACALRDAPEPYRPGEDGLQEPARRPRQRSTRVRGRWPATGQDGATRLRFGQAACFADSINTSSRCQVSPAGRASEAFCRSIAADSAPTPMPRGDHYAWPRRPPATAGRPRHSPRRITPVQYPLRHSRSSLTDSSTRPEAEGNRCGRPGGLALCPRNRMLKPGARSRPPA